MGPKFGAHATHLRGHQKQLREALLRAKKVKAGNPGLGSPEGPSTQYLRFLVPKTIPLMVFGARELKYWVLGPSG